MRPIALCSRVGGLCAVSTLLFALLGCDYTVRVSGFVTAEPEATLSDVLVLKQAEGRVARPLAGATVEIRDDHQVLWLLNSEEDGSFALGGSVTSRVKDYWVRVTCPGYKTASASVTFGTYIMEFKLAPLNPAPPLNRSAPPPAMEEPQEVVPPSPPGESESMGDVAPNRRAVTPPERRAPPSTPPPMAVPPTTAPTPAAPPPGTTPPSGTTPPPGATTPPAARPATPGAAAAAPTTPVQTPESPAAAATGLTPGYYVVARHFRPERSADATAALGVLKRAGFPALLLSESDDLLVVVTQRFATGDAAAPLCAKLKALPPQELATGNYDFSQAYAWPVR